MLDSLFSTFAPHYCLSCGRFGRQICDYCFYDIELSIRETCMVCHRLLQRQQCRTCRNLHGVRQIVLGEREGILERMMDEYKFACRRETHRVFAQLLDVHMPHFPAGSQIVPIPTAPSHIRRRGFDHTRDIYKRFATTRELAYAPLLSRLHNSAQFGATAAQRRYQAARAFKLNADVINVDTHYLLCDDIVTTGASMSAGVKLLRGAGAQHITVVALLQQPWKNQK